MKLSNWLYYSWDFRIGWVNAYEEIRAVGFRLFGMEFEHFELARFGDHGEEIRERTTVQYTAIRAYLQRKEEI
jgi:hypothetical protein